MSVEILLIAVVLVSVCFLAPVRYLPAFSLVIFAFVPKLLMPAFLPVFLHPAFVILSIWIIRRLLGRRESPPRRERFRGLSIAIAISLLGLCLVLWRTATPSTLANISLQWIVALAFGVLVPLLVRDVSQETRVLSRVLPFLAATLAVYAIVEFALAKNIVYDPIYHALGLPAEQKWSTYRSHVSFGHPLYAGTFFAVTTCYFFARWMMGGRALLVFALSAAALVVTVSRGALVATAVGIALAIAAGFFSRRVRPMKKWTSLLLVGSVVVAVVAAGVFQDRVGTTEAVQSDGARAVIVRIALAAAEARGWLGGGPGVSQGLVAVYNPQGFLMENAALQLLVSTGIAGAVLMGAFLAVRVVAAVRNGALPAAAAIVAFSVCMVGYDGLESLPTLQALVAALVLLSRGASARPALAEPRKTALERARPKRVM